MEIPELDKAVFLDMAAARRKIEAAKRALVEECRKPNGSISSQLIYRGAAMSGYLITTMLVLTVSVRICSAAADETPSFKITSNRSDDHLEVKSENDKAVLDVRSPVGISSATIERTIEHWKDTVVIQLRLNGLESFKVSTDKLKLQASVSSQNGDVRL